jgi:CRISPR-associated protein Csm2
MNTRYDNQRPRQGGGSGRPPGGRDFEPGPTLDTSEINLRDPSPHLFDQIAEKTAEAIAESGRRNDCNKSTQLRRFYDEIVMWDQRIRQNKDDYGKFLPLIKMLNAKAAYAAGRKPKLVDENFVLLLRHGLSQLDSDKPGVFYNFKLFMEAFMGFYKLHGPK